MPFLGLLGEICGVERGYAFWSASVDFHALFGLVGGVCGKKGMHFGARVWISMPFLGLLGRFAEWKESMHFGAQVWISMPFLDLSEGFAARKKGMHFGARVWISMPFLGFLEKAAAWKKSRFQDGDEENCCLIWAPRGRLGLSSANGGVFMVPEGLRSMLGPWVWKVGQHFLLSKLEPNQYGWQSLFCETLSQTLQKHSFQKTYQNKFSTS